MRIALIVGINYYEHGNPKPILAIKPWGNINVSSVVAENCDKIVGWNTESIVSGIR